MKPSTVRRDIVSFVTSIRINTSNVNTEHKPLILSVRSGQAVCNSDTCLKVNHGASTQDYLQ